MSKNFAAEPAPDVRSGMNDELDSVTAQWCVVFDFHARP